MTEKLYYKDAYIKEFISEVIECNPCDNGYLVVLRESAFFPEEGGQYSDRGTIGTANVISVSERDGVIYHLTDGSLAVGAQVLGKIDFDERYEKMQIHTAEHILSGLIHSMFGYDNAGFHLGMDEVTMDINAPLTFDELMQVEARANEIIYENIEVNTFFPTPEEAEKMQYRSKLDITENLRIVKIGEYDSCACCAPHVKRTGEIGSIKILDFTGLRGGVRIRIIAGRRAFFLYRDMFSNLAKISHALSVPKLDTGDAVLKYISSAELVKAELKALKISAFEREAELVEKTDKSAVFIFKGAEIDQLRAFANKAVSKIGGILVLLEPTSADCKYILASTSVDLKGEIKKINTALGGRGGGSSVMAQGSFNAPLCDIEKYFKENY